MFLEIILIFATVIFAYKAFFKKGSKLPPGPFHIPYLGSKFPLDDETAKKMANKYGDMFTCYLGVIPAVVISDFKLGKEVLSMPEVSDRPTWRIFASLKNGNIDNHFLGLVSSNGERWQHNRRFALRHLRDLGMGKSRLEDAILFEVADLVKNLKKLNEEPTPFPFYINIAILNVIWQLVASHRYDFHDKEVEKFMKLTNTAQATFFQQAFSDFYPYMLYVLPKALLDRFFGHNTMVRLRQDFNNTVQEYVDEHKKSLDSEDPRDFIDEYIIAMEEDKKNENSFFDNDDLLAALFDLFVAGNDTVAFTTKWMILYMAKHPSVQQRAQEKIDKAVPRDTLPSLEHRASLSYIDALINEVLRVSSFLNNGVSRATSADIVVRGYHIPKNTIILNLAGVQHGNDKYWDNPEKFDPERFLDSNGKVHINMDGHSPFGLGRRQCLGEPLARMELYLFTAALLQNFTFAPPPGEEVDLKPKEAPFFHWPRDQKIVFNARP